MGSYLYRRPFDSSIDTFEKAGRYLSCGLDLWAENVVCFSESQLITRYIPQNCLLYRIAAKVGNIAKLILIPLAPIGLLLTSLSDSYYEFSQLLEKNGVKGKIIQAIPSNDDALTLLAEKLSRLNFLSGSNYLLTIMPETNEVIIKSKATVSFDKLAPKNSNARVPAFDAINIQNRKIFETQLGPFSSFVRGHSKGNTAEDISKDLMASPRKIFIRTDNDSLRSKKVVLTYVNGEDQIVEVPYVHTTLGALKEKFKELQSLTKYSQIIEQHKKLLKEAIPLKRAALENTPTITINENTYQYECVVVAAGESYTLKYPLYLSHEQLQEKVQEDQARIERQNTPHSAPSDDQEHLSIPSEAFIKAKSFNIDVATSYAADSLIERVLELNGYLTEHNHPGKDYYIVAVDYLCKMIGDNPEENWGHLAELIEKGQEVFIQFVDKIVGKDFTEILYVLHMEKQSERMPKQNNLKDALLQRRDLVIEKFIQETAKECAVEEIIVRRELIRLGVGIPFPKIKKQATGSSPFTTNLLESLQAWMTVSQLHPEDIDLPYDNTAMKLFTSATDKFFKEEPYATEIASAKANQAANAPSYEFSTWALDKQAEQAAIENFKRTPVDGTSTLDARVLEIIERLKLQHAALPTNDPEAYHEGKAKLVDAALDENRKRLEAERASGLRGELSDDFYNGLRQRICKDHGFVSEGNITPKGIVHYISTFR